MIGGTHGLSLNDRMEEFSHAYVRAVSAVAGFSAERPVPDKGSIDLRIVVPGHQKIPGPRQIDAQVKCTTISAVEDQYVVFDLPVKNYNDLRLDAIVPRILIVVIVPDHEVVGWIAQSEEELISRRCGYWRSLSGEPDVENTTTVRVRIPRNNVYSVETPWQILTEAGLLGVTP